MLARWLDTLGIRRSPEKAAARAGDAARDRRDWHEASEHYRRAVAIRPDWVPIRVQLGNMLKEAGALRDAEQQYRTALLGEPANADIHLQLGHALKLLSRRAEARDAYLAAAVLDPDLQAVRTELRALGMTADVIERHIAAANRERSGASSEDSRFGEQRVAAPVHGGPRGVIVEIGRNFIAGELCDVAADDLPLTLVCRERKREVAVLLIEQSAVPLPGTIPFRIGFAEPENLGIVECTLEPGEMRLTGSPLLLPNDTGSALLERIAAIEERLTRGTPSEALVTELEHRLMPRVTRMAADQLERVIRYQRESFERQLLVVSARCEPSGNADQRAWPDLQAPAPPELRFTARDAFPGIGWGPVEHGHDGIPVRRIAARAQLTARLAPACSVVLEARICDPTPRARLGRLMVGAAGNWVPFWIEQQHDPITRERYWLLSALIPGPAIQPDGTVTCFLELASDFDGESVTVRDVALHSVPISALTEISCSRSGWWAVQGWNRAEAQMQLAGPATLVLPGAADPRDSWIEIALDGAEPPVIALNGQALTLEARGARVRAQVPASFWRHHDPNLVTFARMPDAKEHWPRVLALRVADRDMES